MKASGLKPLPQQTRGHATHIALAALAASSLEQPHRYSQHQHGRQQVGDTEVELERASEAAELQLQQPEAECEQDAQEQLLAQPAAAQAAESERDGGQAQGEHVERIEPCLLYTSRCV